MIVVKLQGGLGNQLFQYAAARGLQETAAPVYTDNSFFKHTNSTDTFTARKYELSLFKNVHVKKAPAFVTNLLTSESSFYKKMRSFFSASIQHVQQEEHIYKPFQAVAGYRFVYLDGYFQCEKYFSHIRTELLHEFTFPELDAANTAIQQQITKAVNSVSVHIRRGDYLKPFFANVLPVLPLDYYYCALKILQQAYGKLNIFVFSDDATWAKENFVWEDADTCFIEQNKGDDSWKDMVLMSACKHHIVANSSFSWWGAWLSTNEGRQFAPFNWFNPQHTRFNIYDIVPQHWEVIQYA